MQDYIIINGKPSYEIPGLIICTLPPIAKPPKKISTLSIPGADGDIVTSLGGYDPYERRFRVAVSRSAGDMETVVEYLAQDGEIIYSNEPDKIYQMRQTSRIDFASLTRYRQADVVQVVQPIKRSVMAPLNVNVPVGELGVPYDIQNAGNTTSRPRFVIVTSTDSCELIYRRSDGETFTILIDPGIPYQDLTITLDASTGNATGTLDTGNPATSRTGWLTDLVSVSGGDITDLTVPPDATPSTIEVSVDSNSVPQSLKVFDFIAYI